MARGTVDDEVYGGLIPPVQAESILPYESASDLSTVFTPAGKHQQGGGSLSPRVQNG